MPHAPDDDAAGPTPTPDPAPPRRLTAEQQSLAERYLPMARALARPARLAHPGGSADFAAVALAGLVEAARSWDPARGVKFSTFARWRVLGAIKDARRAAALRGYAGDPDPPRVASLIDLRCGVTRHDLHGHAFDRDVPAEWNGRVVTARPDRPVGEALESAEWVESRLRNLPPKQAAAARAVYLEGMSQGEAAAALGYSRSRLSCLLKDARLRVGEALAAEARRDNDPGRYDSFRVPGPPRKKKL